MKQQDISNFSLGNYGCYRRKIRIASRIIFVIVELFIYLFCIQFFTALKAILAQKTNIEGLTSKDAKIMKILLPEWSLITHRELALKLL